MRIALGCDHAGLHLKNLVASTLQELGHTYEDFGCFSTTSVDYPDIAIPVAQAVAEGKFQLGILVCSTGIGMALAANKIPGVRAAVCHDNFCAQRAREHNDANVLCLGEGVIGTGVAREVLRAFLGGQFVGGRHARRLEKIRSVENAHRVKEVVPPVKS